MTMIARGFPTKKSLREAIAAGVVPEFEDPSLMADWLKFGKRHFTLADLRVGDSFVATNHPKRSWFAEIIRTAENTWKVL